MILTAHIIWRSFDLTGDIITCCYDRIMGLFKRKYKYFALTAVQRGEDGDTTTARFVLESTRIKHSTDIESIEAHLTKALAEKDDSITGVSINFLTRI